MWVSGLIKLRIENWESGIENLESVRSSGSRAIVGVFRVQRIGFRFGFAEIALTWHSMQSWFAHVAPSVFQFVVLVEVVMIYDAILLFYYFQGCRQ